MLMASGPASAQNVQDFSALRARIGETIYVTDAATGVEVGGKLTMLAPGALSIDGYTFAPAEGLKIERPGDPIWDGALIGFGVGALFGVTVGSEACLNRAHWHCAVEGGTSYALLGAIIDFAHKGRRTIYKGRLAAPRRTVRLRPDLRPDRKAVSLALAF